MPGTEMDELIHYESSKSRHIVVWCKGFYYCMPICDDGNQLLCAHSLEQLFDEIREDAEKQAG